jgi:hypothetical protein
MVTAQNRPREGSSLRLVLCCVLLSSISIGATLIANADDCPSASDAIATNRPSVTNSSVVVPFGSLQAENGVDWTVRDGSNSLDASNTVLRAGLAHCAEIVVNVPSYFGTLNGSQPSGFSDVVFSVKRQVPLPFGFDGSPTIGVAFPGGATRIAGRGYQPYVQFPWSRSATSDWTVAGMLTLFWAPGESSSNVTFEPTFSLTRQFGPSADLFLEYVGLIDHQPPAHLLDAGGAWIFASNQQVDFHLGVGLNRSSAALNGVPAAQYFGFGYSIRLDNLFGASASASSP